MAVAVAGVICGALLSWRARSAIPAVVVIGTVGAAALAEKALKAVVERTAWTPAELQYLPLLHYQHSFSSGHVTGNAALLGIIAVCLGAGRSRTVQTLYKQCWQVLGFPDYSRWRSYRREWRGGGHDGMGRPVVVTFGAYAGNS